MNAPIVELVSDDGVVGHLWLGDDGRVASDDPGDQALLFPAVAYDGDVAVTAESNPRRWLELAPRMFRGPYLWARLAEGPSNPVPSVSPPIVPSSPPGVRRFFNPYARPLNVSQRAVPTDWDFEPADVVQAKQRDAIVEGARWLVDDVRAGTYTADVAIGTLREYKARLEAFDAIDTTDDIAAVRRQAAEAGLTL